jgi:TonB family protein
MRRTFIAGLLFSPILLASAANAIQPKGEENGPAPERRISTGVSAPQLLDSSDLHISPSGLEAGFPNNAKVVLALDVDASGNPENIRVIKSSFPELNASVISAASKFHFRPATLDEKPVALPIELNVLVQR